MRHFKIAAVLAACAIVLCVGTATQGAEPFTDIGAGLTGVQWCSLAWGDYDNDGDLDLALAGSYVSKVYRNDGGTFTAIGAGLTGVDWCSLAWGDYDNDGDLDLALAGRTTSTSPFDPISKVYRNDGGAFTAIGVGLTGVYACSLAWGDYDNDGDLDLALAGESSSGFVSKVYRNDGGTFTAIGAGLTAVAWGCSLAWGDYDNDGDLDLALAGDSGGPNAVTKVYRNDGGTFTVIGAGLTGVYACSLVRGDYDNDGDLDLALAGGWYDGSWHPISNIYRNDGGTFTAIGAGLTAVLYCSLAWGDYDNDGDLDLALAGHDATYNPVSKVYRNDGGAFTDIGAALTAVGYCSLAWGDYDNDGDLDLALAGSGTSKVYRNDGGVFNTAPAAPGGLSASVAGNDVTFSWIAATDAETPALGLSYNLRVGTTPGGNEVSSGMADSTTGWRRIPATGNAQKVLSWTLTGLTPGTYYWSVQAVDSGLAGSAWAGEQTVTVVTPPPSIVSVTADDPDDGDTVYGPGDTITITFDNGTNQSAAVTGTKTGAEMDLLFVLSGGHTFGDGTDSFLLEWIPDARTLRITVQAVSSCNVAIGDTFTVLDAAGIKNAAGTSLNCTETSPAMTGNWGTTVPGGLLAHWEFEETSGTVAADSSGNANDGVLVNMPGDSTNWVAGKVGSYALQFDGTDDYVDCGSGINLANQSFSISVWAKRGAPGTDDWIVTLGTTESANLHLHFGFRDSNQFTLAFWVDDLSVGSYTDSDWHHWVGTYDSSTMTQTLYRDAVQVGARTANAQFQGTGPFTIGRRASGGNYVGLLDDLRIYDRALLAAEIADLVGPLPPAITSTAPPRAGIGYLYSYTITAAGNPAPTFSVGGLPGWLTFDGTDTISGTPSAADPALTGTITVTATNSEGSDQQLFEITVSDADPSLVGHWKLDEASGTTAADSSGYGNDGGVCGNPVWLPSGGHVDGTLDHDGYDGSDDYVEIPDSPSLRNIQEADYTLAAWVCPDTIPPGTGSDNNAEYAILVKQGWHLGLTIYSTGQFKMVHWFEGDIGIGATSANTFASGSFYHVCMVLSKTNGTVELYVNGVLEGSQTFTAGSSAREYAAIPWRIGIVGPGVPSYRYAMDGKIDDVRIYNRALSHTEVLALVGPIPPTITSPAPTDACVDRPYTYTITATGNPTPTLSVSGLPAWLSFDAVDTISGTPPAVETTGLITVTATNGVSPDYTQQFQITVSNVPAPEWRILREWWRDILGSAVPDLTGNADYPDNPTGSEYVTAFEGPVNWRGNYGARFRGYVHPPQSGDYVFHITSDDTSELWLSTDDAPANAIKILEIVASAPYGDWSNQSAPVTLAAGQRYYVEVLHKESAGDDHVRVGWTLPDLVFEGPIPGSRLSPWYDTSTPPSITTQPADQTVTEGSTATFTVSAAGSAPLSYQWQEWSGSAWADVTAGTGYTTDMYTTLATTLADDGAQYRCVVTNASGSVTSNAATLTVNMAPPTITTHPSNHAVTEGQTATFTVVATGSGTLTYQWKKDGTDISGATNSSYTTPATVLADDGAQYTCIATNAGGSVTSNTATLTVNMAPPTITTHPSNQAVMEGQTATFTVVATGSGTLTYQWKKDGTDIGGATSASYTTPATTVADDGAQYTCVVTNAGGSTESNAATLSVNMAAATITLTYPNGGEVWLPGSFETISWYAENVTGDVDIYYSTDGGTTWQHIGSAPASQGWYSWTTPSVSSTECRVKVMKPGGAWDESDSDFAIVNSGIVIEPRVIEFRGMAGTLGGVLLDTFTVRYVARAVEPDVFVALDRGRLPGCCEIDLTGFVLGPGGEQSITVTLDAPGLPRETSIHEYVKAAIVADAAGLEVSSASIDASVNVDPSRIVTGCAPPAGGGGSVIATGAGVAALPYVLIFAAALACTARRRGRV